MCADKNQIHELWKNTNDLIFIKATYFCDLVAHSFIYLFVYEKLFLHCYRHPRVAYCL